MGALMLMMMMMATAMAKLCDGAVYKVGDTAGWTTIGNVDYKQWSATKTFQLGDTIRKSLQCSSDRIQLSELLSFAKSQVILGVDYILGDNLRATSYMVGYGNNYPRQVHHWAASIVSIKEDSSFVSCRGGYATWFSRKASEPNLLTGAIVGVPDAHDNFADQRDSYKQMEPATYNNVPLLGILARLSGGHGGYSQLLPAVVPAPKAVVAKPSRGQANNSFQ